MGQKVHPYSFRIGVINDWKSKWFSQKKYRQNFHQDLKIKKYITEKMSHAAVADITIERSAGQVTVNIHTARPGIIIGRGGNGVDELKNKLKIIIAGPEKLQINIIEIRQPDTFASLVAQNIAAQIEKRIPYKRAIKQAIDRALQARVEGIKITVKGRLNNVDIARTETFSKGKIPLHTIRANIDYCGLPAFTPTAGKIGVRVWIYKGEVFNKDKNRDQIKESNPDKSRHHNRLDSKKKR
ncbi:MAG: 30S ribosomal protein S3 [Patescibacteria group bacterium]